MLSPIILVFEYIRSINQGWLLVWTTSIITIMGCSIIYLDLLYKSLFPSLFRKYPFDISNNTSFLICSLSLSAGCLLFTSMFKLLPEALKYFSKIPSLSKDSQKLMSSSLGFYMLGIVICGLLNVMVHFFTSESIVHCVHGDEDEEAQHHGHDHAHSHGHEHLHNETQSQPLSHSHADPFSHSHADYHSHSHSHSSSSISDEGLKRQSLTDSNETSPLLNRNVKLSIENDQSKSSSDDSFEAYHPHPNSNNCKVHSHSQTNILPPPSAINYNSTNNISDDYPTITDRHHLNHSSSRPHLDKRESLMDMALKAIKGTVCEGKCLGYDSVENCCLKTTSKPVLLDRNNHSDHDHVLPPHPHSQDCHIHSTIPTETVLNDNLDDSLIIKKQANLHYCELPSSENILFFDKSRTLIKNNSKLNIEFPELQVISPLIEDDGNHHILENNSHPHTDYDIENQHHHQHHQQQQQINNKTTTSANNNLAPVTSNDSDYFNLTQHHHHVTTPLSRLLSIGLQTVLAITLHKFPEGFIMYSTSQADPKLGLSIFLSMFIHNFVEGFTMTLPIYIALNSRIKALLIAGTLGSLSQPFGAFLGYLLFKDALLDMNDPQTNFIFGSLIAITSGFLTIIGFQMFASSISFGGRQSTVLIWMCIGIALICFSTILIASTG